MTYTILISDLGVSKNRKTHRRYLTKYSHDIQILLSALFVELSVTTSFTSILSRGNPHKTNIRTQTQHETKRSLKSSLE